MKHTVKHTIIAVALVLVHSAVNAQSVLYVRADGNDLNDGTSWARAKRTIQAAIDAAFAGTEIRVAQGVYQPIVLTQNLVLKGGYAGTGANPNDRDPARYPTIIDGSGTSRVIELDFNATNATIIEGFIIQNGRATFDAQWGGAYGGGLRLYRGSPIIRNNVFRNNRAFGENAAGSALYIYRGSPIIENNLFEDNFTECTFSSGTGGALALDRPENTVIRNNRFIRNRLISSSEAYGGAVFMSRGSGIIERNIFLENYAQGGGFQPTSEGGALYIYNNNGYQIRNNLFAFNQTFADGGFSPTARGGALGCYTSTAPLQVYNNTFYANRAVTTDAESPGQGYAVYSYEADVDLRNNILAGHLGSVVYHYGGREKAIRVSFNCFFNDTPFELDGAVVDDGNNLFQDPRFVDADGGDFRLRQGSPCIDAGDNSVVNWSLDLAGNPRIQNGRVDLGAYEGGVNSGGRPGDVNGDGCVNDADLLTVLFSFGRTGQNPADVNGNGIVDDADLLIVLFNFGQGC